MQDLYESEVYSGNAVSSLRPGPAKTAENCWPSLAHRPVQSAHEVLTLSHWYNEYHLLQGEEDGKGRKSRDRPKSEETSEASRSVTALADV